LLIYEEEIQKTKKYDKTIILKMKNSESITSQMKSEEQVNLDVYLKFHFYRLLNKFKAYEL
jgi:hypothetical protein